MKWTSQPNLLRREAPLGSPLVAHAKEQVESLFRCPTAILAIQGSVTETSIPGLRHSADHQRRSRRASQWRCQSVVHLQAGTMHVIYLWTCWNSHGTIIRILQIRKLRLRVEKLPKALSLAGARLSQYLLSMEQGEWPYFLT